jgi:hypothetical protein
MVIIISYKRKNKLGKQRQIQWKRLNATSDVKKKTELNTNRYKEKKRERERKENERKERECRRVLRVPSDLSYLHLLSEQIVLIYLNNSYDHFIVTLNFMSIIK